MEKVTIEGLAIMIDKRFEGVDGQLGGIGTRLDKVEIQMKEGFDHVENRFDHVDARLSTIERDIAEIRKHFVYRDEFEDLMSRVKYLEGKLGIVSGK